MQHSVATDVLASGIGQRVACARLSVAQFGCFLGKVVVRLGAP